MSTSRGLCGFIRHPIKRARYQCTRIGGKRAHVKLDHIEGEILAPQDMTTLRAILLITPRVRNGMLIPTMLLN